MANIRTIWAALLTCACLWTSAGASESWISLFDGKTLAGWRNFNSDTLQGWTVENGCLVALGTGGDHAFDIICTDTFSHFELVVEWKVDPQANSGIFYYAQEMPGVKAIYEIAPEYQLIDEAGWEGTLKEWQKTGAAYAMYVPTVSKSLKPQGEFNSTRIVAKNGHIEHWLNGTKLLEYQMWSEDWAAKKASGKWDNAPLYGTTHSGHIGLQDHGNRTYFKTVKIKRL